MKRVLITEGDAAGIGREIILKALSDESVRKKANPLVIGSKKDFEKTFDMLISNGVLKEKFELDIVDAIPEYNGKMGEISGFAGKNSYICVEKAVEMVKNGEGASICTAPVNKQSLREGGVPYIGHTEMLAALSNVENPLTVFETNELRIFFFTRHIPFAKISESIKEEPLYNFILRSEKANVMLGKSEKPIAVAALNPHGSDGGLMGNEEKEIEKAVIRARKAGVNAVGPIPADSVFSMCLEGKFSAVLSLYHDQGHIAAKTLDFNGTISLTAGLPFLRTSPDHGTAFDIAGKGVANEKAMKLAILRAASVF